METPSKPQVAVESDLSAILHYALEKLRTVLVKEAGEGVMPYHIFANATMKQMCVRIPRTLEELRDIHGIGDVKVIKKVLETIEATIKESAKTDKMETPLKPQVVVESDFSAKLYIALGKLRTVLVKEAGKGVITYHIFPNNTMKQICERIPRTLEELSDIHGIGSAKLNKYGTRVLETIEATINENADALEKNTISNGKSESVKRKRDHAEIETPSKPVNSAESDFSTKLYTALKKLRTSLVKEAGEGVVAFHIFQNSTLELICERIPRTLEKLRDIHGIGNSKLNKYGARVLETIEATIKENAEAYENHTSSKMETPLKPQAIVTSDLSAKLYKALQKLRKLLVKEAGEGVYLYHIFPNVTIKQMCERIPRTLDELRDIYGFGSVKVNKYGSRVLETIEAIIKENDAAYKNNSSNNGRLDSVKRKRDRADFSAKLYNALRMLRKVLAEEAGEGVMLYHIFTNNTLKQICEKVPRTSEELLDIHGIRNVKVNKYGARVLETIEAAIKENTKIDENTCEDSAKRGRDQAECDDDLVKSIGRWKKRVSSKQFLSAEVVDYDKSLDNYEIDSINSNMETVTSDPKVGVNGGIPS